MASTINASNSGFGGIVSTGDSSGVLQLQTANTTAVTIDASQNVGIGTTSPSANYSLTTQTGIIVNNQATDITPNTTWSGQITARGNGYQGGIALDATGMWVGHNSAVRALLFATDETERMRIDSSGNVGIGTSTSPNSSGYGTFLNVRGSANAAIYIGDNGAAANNLMLAHTSTVASVRTEDAVPLAFGTSGSERMRIDSSGNVLVGTTSLPANGGLLFVAGGISSNSGYQTKAGNTSALSGNRFNINWTGTAQLWIDSTNIGTFAFTSDYRIKKNIETSTTPALERISQIRPVTYQMADYGTLFKASEEVKEGFIAHELAEVIPSAVEGEKDAEDQIQSLKLDALCSVMVKAIQEQQTIINDLKARIETLESK